MPLSFVPKIIVDRLTDVTPEMLQRYGVQFLMLDFDNTIVPYTTNTPTDEMEQWLRSMLGSEIGICVVSNSKRDRVVKFCDARGIPCITHSKKPFQRGIRKCGEQFGLDMAHAALAGDQIYTDVLGGNCAGVQSILVKAIDNHNFWLKARHVLEKPWIFIARKRRIQNEKS